LDVRTRSIEKKKSGNLLTTVRDQRGSGNGIFVNTMRSWSDARNETRGGVCRTDFRDTEGNT